jgi:pimeloyl-ACP methyl ester carboxylesterase
VKLEIVSKKPKGISRAVPILFVHGAWHGAWCWEKNVMPYFAENGYFRLMQDESYLAFLDMMLFNLPNPEKVSTELLILGADEDAIFHPDEIEATAAAYGKEPEIFRGMAHDMMLEIGWQAVADRIIRWLDEKGM